MIPKIALFSIFTILIKNVVGIIKDDNFQIPSHTAVLFDSFSFQQGGNYTFSLNSIKPTLKPEILLAVAAKGINCDMIGKTCVYELFKNSDICNNQTAFDLHSKIKFGYPIIPSSYSLIPANQNFVDSFEALPWERYTDFGNNTFIEHLYNKIMPIILPMINYKIRNITEYYNDSQNISSKELIGSFTSNFSGMINESARIYFAAISCSNETIDFHVHYRFVNPKGEELSFTEIPYKVFFIKIN